MAVTDLSLVSQTLRELLRTNVNRIVGPSGATVSVTLGFPETVDGAERTINLHLYHVAEDQFNRNRPGPGSDPNQVATSPLTLSLFYLMTSHHNGQFQAETEQEIMGHALKTLHDFPLIGQDTQMLSVDGVISPVLIGSLRDGDTLMEVILRPLSPEDALNYWASEQQQAVRLAAYYEVRLTQLEPEPSRRTDGIVFSVGQWVGPMVDLRLDRSRSAIDFDPPPTIAGTLPQRIEISPDRVFLDYPPVTATFPETNRFWLEGRNFASGIKRRVVVGADDWEDRGVPGCEIALPAAALPPAPTGSWGVAFEAERVEIALSPRLDYTDSSGGAATLDILPGEHRARVEIVLEERPEPGGTKEIVRRSNSVTFLVAPRIDDATFDGATGRWTIALSPHFDMTDSTLENVIAVDGVVYEAKAFSGTLANDRGRVTLGTHSVTLQPIADWAAGSVHPVRLSVNGIDAQPFWIEVGP